MKVNNTKDKLYTFRGCKGKEVVLFPKLNLNVDESIKAHPVFKDKVNKGIFRIVNDEQVKAEDLSAEDGDKKPAAQLVAEMPEIMDIKVLRELESDRRSTVAQAAKKQLAKIDEMGGE